MSESGAPAGESNDVPTPPPGWYDDPHHLSRLRYWDGSTWTEYVHNRVEVAPPIPPPIAARMAGESDGSINDIGQWLKSSFQVAWSRLLPGLFLLFVGFAPFAVTAALGFWVIVDVADAAAVAFGDGLAATESFFTSDLNFTVLSGLVVSFLVGAVMSMVAQVALAELMHSAHAGRRSGVVRAVGVGLRRCWALIGWLVAFASVGFLLAAVGFGFVAGATVMDAWLGVVVGFVVILVLMLFLVYFAVRLAFLPVACAVAPAGTGKLSAALEPAKGRFWPVAGRVLLLLALSYLVLLPVQTLTSVFLPGIDVAVFVEMAETGSIDATSLVAALGPTLAIGSLVSMLAIGLYQMFNVSALSRLYIDLDGPASES